MARRKKLKVFTAGFHGHWIGGDAVVVAESKEDAYNILKAKLDSMHIRRPHNLKMENVVEVDLYTPGVTILSDGEY